MLAVAENVNVMSARVAEAMRDRRKDPIQKLARAVVDAGADAVEVNLGPARRGGEETMVFLVDAIAEVARVQLCLDTTNPGAMEAGIVRCLERGLPTPIVNSFSAEPEKMEAFLPLAATYGCELIGLTMSRSVPVTAAERLEIAYELVVAANESGVSNDRLFIDPIVLPLGVDVGQQHALAVQEVVATAPQMFDPPVRTICGLSNVSNGAPREVRPAINNVFLSMLSGLGLSSAILDAMDRETMRTVRLIRALTNRSLYAASDAELR